MRETRIPRPLEIKNYLNNYFAMYTRLTCSGIRVELASTTYNFLLNVVLIDQFPFFIKIFLFFVIIFLYSS